MKVLVTGNLGYIGTVLTPYLEARGHAVRGLDVGYFEDCILGEVSGLADQLHRDIRDVELIDLDGVEGVVHLAGLSNDPLGEFDVALTESDAPSLAAPRGAELVIALQGLEGVEAVRGLGLLIGVELTAACLQDRTATDVARLCLDAGLIVNGVTSTALRLAPPLTITPAEIIEGVAILASVLNRGGVAT